LGNKILLAAAAVFLLSLAPAAVLAATTITFATDHQIGGEGGYDGYASIDVSGNVNPPPTSGSVTITTTNPQGIVVDSSSVPLQPGTGMFEDLVIAGCTSDWTSGTYAITVSLAGSPPVVATTTFGYIVDSPAVDSVSIKVTPQSISGTGVVTISGGVEACGGSAAQSSVVLTVKNPTGSTVFSQVSQPITYSQPEDGNYSVDFTAGGTPQWIPGNYTASAFYTSTQSVGTPASAAASFVYDGNSTQTSSTQTTAQNSATQTSAAQSSTVQTSSSPSTSQATSSAGSAQSTASSAPATSTAPSGSTNKGSGAPLVPYVVAIAIAAGVAGTFVGLRGRQKSPKS